jgi:hypothetical protein
MGKITTVQVKKGCAHPIIPLHFFVIPAKAGTQERLRIRNNYPGRDF